MEVIVIDPSNLESLANAVMIGITTPELLADWIGIDLVDDCLVLDNSSIFADDGFAEIEYSTELSATEASQEYVDSGDWNLNNSTKWINVHTYKKGINESGQIVPCNFENHSVELNPQEPECVFDNEHEWKSPYSIVGGCEENPGVHGSGGGVIITECCMLCGCKKQTDTWAQDPSNGEQGLTSIEYFEHEYSDEVNDRLIKKAKLVLDNNAEQNEEFDFIWKNSENCLVGASNDELLEYGIELRMNSNAVPITGTELSLF